MGGYPRDVASRVGGRGRHRAARRHGVAVRARRRVWAMPDLQQRTLALRTAPRSHRLRLPSHVRRPYARSKDAAVTRTLGIERDPLAGSARDDRPAGSRGGFRLAEVGGERGADGGRRPPLALSPCVGASRVGASRAAADDDGNARSAAKAGTGPTALADDPALCDFLRVRALDAAERAPPRAQEPTRLRDRLPLHVRHDAAHRGRRSDYPSVARVSDRRLESAALHGKRPLFALRAFPALLSTTSF
jgi:hypothetical protein